VRRPGKAAAKAVVREETRRQETYEAIRRAVNRISTRLQTFRTSFRTGGDYQPTPAAREGTRLWKQMELSWKELAQWQRALVSWDGPLSRAYREVDPEASVSFGSGHNTFPLSLDLWAGIVWGARYIQSSAPIQPFSQDVWLRNETRIMALINALYDQGAGVDLVDPDCPVPIGSDLGRIGDIPAERIEKMADWLVDHPAEEAQYAQDVCGYMLALEWMMASAEALMDWVEEVDAQIPVDPIVGKTPLPDEEWAKLQVVDQVFEHGRRGWY